MHTQHYLPQQLSRCTSDLAAEQCPSPSSITALHVHHLLVTMVSYSVFNPDGIAPDSQAARSPLNGSLACARSRRSLRRAVQRAVNEAARAGAQLSAELEELPQLDSSPQGA